MPTSEEDIVAIRTRIAEGAVPWNREKAVREAIASAKVKRVARRRKRIVTAASLALILSALLAWLLIRR